MLTLHAARRSLESPLLDQTPSPQQILLEKQMIEAGRSVTGQWCLQIDAHIPQISALSVWGGYPIGRGMPSLGDLRGLAYFAMLDKGIAIGHPCNVIGDGARLAVCPCLALHLTSSGLVFAR